MPQVDFYHLTASPLDQVLPRICEKVLAGGERLLVVAGEEKLATLDTTLWAGGRDSFLAHGLASAPNPERQPILLASSLDPVNGAGNVALADGVWREEALNFGRVFYFFDAENVDGARDAWRSLKQREGVECRYWKQDGGKWVQGP